MTRALSEAIDALMGLIAREKAALLTGDFAAVGATAKEKARGAATLDAAIIAATAAGTAPAFRTRIAKLAAAASENEGLLEAAKNGVTSARARLQDILQRERNVGVYGEGGGKIVSAEAGVTRRKTA